MSRVIKLLFVIGLSLLFFNQAVAAGNNHDYSSWLKSFKEDALRAGIKPATLDVALTGVKPLDWIIKLDRSQPEFTKSLEKYLAGAVTKLRVKRGRILHTENSPLLTRIAQKYRVQPRFLLSLWGIETSFGRYTGSVPVFAALVTLAYDGRRNQYFRTELLIALEIIDRGLMTSAQMKGSWAGAMGQVQFMPTTFLNFAVDGNGDGRIDLWDTRADYLSSAANYLHRSGWDHNYTWGREVTLTKKISKNDFGLERQLLLHEWQKLGVRTVKGLDLPTVELAASLIQPDGAPGRTFLVYANYRVLLKWNRAHRFAIAVGTLADQIDPR
jgi:membrane-bound lytic murein transglycosylase B